MARTVILTVTLLIMIATVSDASFLTNFRDLLAELKGEDKSSYQEVSPSSTPKPSPKMDPLDSNQKPPLKPRKSSRPERMAPQSPKDGDHAGVPGPTNNTTPVTCDTSSEKCQEADLVACIQHTGDGSKKIFLLVQNGGEDTLSVNIAGLSTMHIDMKKLQLTKHRAEKIDLPTNVTDDIKIVLNAGKGDCVLHIRSSISSWNPLETFSSYTSGQTPVYGAYFLFLTLAFIGVAWTCWRCRSKARRESGAPYQQLEMGSLPQSQPVAGDSNTDGWGQGWEDEWDDREAAVRPLEENPPGAESSNGLASRFNTKDGWDSDWDD